MKLSGGIIENVYPSQIVNTAILTADTTLGAVTAWTPIGAGYTVPDGQAVRLGHGELGGQDNAQGRLYYDIVDDAAGAEDGLIRIVAENPAGTKQIILYQGSTLKGRAATADDRAGQIPFPERGPWIPQFWTIKVYMKPDAAGDVVDVSACTFVMDVLTADFRPA